MQSLQQIRAEVSRRAAVAMMPALLERVTLFHARRQWRDCPCSDCQTKRLASLRIASAKGARREQLRGEFSARLQRLMTECSK